MPSGLMEIIMATLQMLEKRQQLGWNMGRGLGWLGAQTSVESTVVS